MPTLTQNGCQDRQNRFRTRLAERNIDTAVLMDCRDVYYFTGKLLPDTFPVFMLLETDGGCWVVSHTDGAVACVDDWIAYEWHQLDTLNFDLMSQLNAVVKGKLQDVAPVRRLGVQYESVSSLLLHTVDSALQSSELIAFDDTLSEVQRCKHADELEMLRWRPGRFVGFTAHENNEGELCIVSSKLIIFLNVALVSTFAEHRYSQEC